MKDCIKVAMTLKAAAMTKMLADLYTAKTPLNSYPNPMSTKTMVRSAPGFY